MHQTAEKGEGMVSADAERLAGFVEAQPLMRNVMYAVLAACRERRVDSFELENLVANHPDGARSGQSPWAVLKSLVDAEGLREIELGASGVEVTPDDKRGLSDDEVDDLVEARAYLDTPAGAEVAAFSAPAQRIRRQSGERNVSEAELALALEAVARSAGAAQLDERLHELNQDGMTTSPANALDVLERSGAVRWAEGIWHVTREGEEWLDEQRGNMTLTDKEER